MTAAQLIGGPCDGLELPQGAHGMRVLVPQFVSRPIDPDNIELGTWQRDAVYERQGDNFHFVHFTDPVFVPWRF